MRMVGMLVCALMLGGCASGPAFDYVRETYKDSNLVLHTYKDRPLQIFDKPEAGSLVITPTVGEAAAMGAVYGATWGAADQSTFTKPYADAAADFLAENGRQCRIVSTELLVRPMYEVKYDCSAPQRPAPAARSKR